MVLVTRALLARAADETVWDLICPELIRCEPIEAKSCEYSTVLLHG